MKTVFYCADCMDVMSGMPAGSIDIVLTSPFYNTNAKAKGGHTLMNTRTKDKIHPHIRYDVHVDDMTDEQYCEYTVSLFNEFNRVLSENGVVLYNISYGGGNDNMFNAMSDVIRKTPFMIADVIVWHKKSALPDSQSPNALTRICEFVFVLCRREERLTYHANKEAVSKRDTGQQMYRPIYNYISAANNDGPCEFNKATYSSELCRKLLKIYAAEGSTVYDPFMGTGTTAIACEELGLDCIGTEISMNQVKYSVDRMLKRFDYLNEVWSDNRCVITGHEGEFNEKRESAQQVMMQI